MSTITKIRHYSTRNLNQQNFGKQDVCVLHKSHMENILKEKGKIKWKILGPIKQRKDTIKENHKEDVYQVKKGTR